MSSMSDEFKTILLKFLAAREDAQRRVYATQDRLRQHQEMAVIARIDLDSDERALAETQLLLDEVWKDFRGEVEKGQMKEPEVPA